VFVPSKPLQSKIMFVRKALAYSGGARAPYSIAHKLFIRKKRVLRIRGHTKEEKRFISLATVYVRAMLTRRHDYGSIETTSNPVGTNVIVSMISVDCQGQGILKGEVSLYR
jgi:hypothetical protein